MGEPERDPAARARSSLVMRRTTLAISQLELAGRIGVSQGAVSAMETAKYGTNYKIDTLEAWAVALGGHIRVTVEYDEIEEAAERAWRIIHPKTRDTWATVGEQTRNVYRMVAREILGGRS